MSETPPERPARWPLMALLLAGAVIHGLILAQALGQNPLASRPVNDSAVYWDWAGRIAGGELVGERPFFSAPLYPYLLGLVRALGGGLSTVYLLQLALHLGTAALLARAGTLVFDRRVGLVAAALWLLLTGPAYYVARVLAGGLQCFLVALVLERAASLAREPTTKRFALLGAALGALTLAWPPTLGAVAVLAVWAWVVGGRGAAGLRSALALAGVAALTVAPATLHNALACEEWIPISAHGGITFFHGNNPSANGVFSLPKEMSADKATYDTEALEIVRAERGSQAGWRDVSSHFMGKGLAWWRAEPGRALALAAKKAWWFLSGRHYGDMYLPTLEREEGLASRLALAPLPVAWLALPACVAAVLLLLPGRGRRAPHLPEALLLAVPFAVCTVFWYTDRYRMPATPPMALLSAWVLGRVLAWREAPRRAGWLAGTVVVAALTGVVNRALEMDRPATFRPQYELRMGKVAERAGDLEEAARRYGAATEAGHPAAAGRLANLAAALISHGRAEDAVELLQRALAVDPLLPDAQYNLGVALLGLDRAEDAIAAWRAELERDSDHEAARGKLESALRQTGRHAEAAAEARAMLARRPEHVGARLVLAWLLATSTDDDLRDGAEALRLAEELERETQGSGPGVLDTLAAACAESGDLERAVRVGERAASAWRALGRESEAAAVEARVAGYRSGRPHRE